MTVCDDVISASPDFLKGQMPCGKLKWVSLLKFHTPCERFKKHLIRGSVNFKQISFFWHFLMNHIPRLKFTLKGYRCIQKFTLPLRYTFPIFHKECKDFQWSSPMVDSLNLSPSKYLLLCHLKMEKYYYTDRQKYCCNQLL